MWWIFVGIKITNNESPIFLSFFSLYKNWKLGLKNVWLCIERSYDRNSTPNIVLHKSHSHSGELTSQKNRYSIHRCYLRLKWLNFRRGNWSKKNIVLSSYSSKTSNTNTTTGWIFSIEYGLHAMCNLQFVTWKLIW